MKRTTFLFLVAAVIAAAFALAVAAQMLTAGR